MNVFDAPERVRRDSPPRRTDVPIRSRDRREIRIAASDLKSLNSAIQLDQLLYDTIVRRSRYTSADIVTNILEDFFIYNLAMKLNVIFTPRNPALFPDTLGKFLTVTLINLEPMERCRLLFELYPCQHLTRQDLETCGRLGFTRCSPANDPPEGYDYGIWDILDQMKEKIINSHGYDEEDHEPYVILRTVDGPRRRKRSLFKKRPTGMGTRPRPRPIFNPRPRPNIATTGTAPINTNVLLQRNQHITGLLGAGTGTAAGVRGAAAGGLPRPGLFNSMSSQDIRSMGTGAAAPAFTRTQSLTDLSKTSASKTNVRGAPPNSPSSVSGSQASMSSFDSKLSISSDSTLRASAGGLQGMGGRTSSMAGK